MEGEEEIARTAWRNLSAKQKEEKASAWMPSSKAKI